MAHGIDQVLDDLCGRICLDWGPRDAHRRDGGDATGRGHGDTAQRGDGAHRVRVVGGREWGDGYGGHL